MILTMSRQGKVQQILVLFSILIFVCNSKAAHCAAALLCVKSQQQNAKKYIQNTQPLQTISAYFIWRFQKDYF